MDAWIYVVGMLPHKVVAYEDTARKGVVYLRWRVAGDWVRRSLGFTLRDAKGKVSKDAEKRARRAADEHYGRLIAGGAMPAAPAHELTIAEGWSLAIDDERGKWRKDTAHRREMARALDRAKATWGARTAWNAIDRGEMRRLWRAELKRVRATGRDGVRSAEIVMARVVAVANWLREEGKISGTACLPWGGMKAEMADDFGSYAVKRLRYSADEYRAILAAAPLVDVRWALLLTLGAEYRLGQVSRSLRSQLDPDKGTLMIRGAGKKRGTLVVLTADQHEAVHVALGGWLQPLELAYLTRGMDYPLFPGWRVPMRDGVPVLRADHASREPLNRTTLRYWLEATEAKAQVAHVEGRGWYGLRRVAVDLAKASGISREGLQQSGGWADAQVPDRIYADQEARYAAEEAAKVRAKIRGETEQNGARTQNGPAGAGPSFTSNDSNDANLH